MKNMIIILFIAVIIMGLLSLYRYINTVNNLSTIETFLSKS